MFSFIPKVLTQLKKAFFHSIDGLSAAFKEEFAFQLEVYAGIIAVPAVFLIGHSALERAALFASYMLVPLVELLNSALEITLNRISLERHELTKKAKDIGSAAVFLALVNGVFVWLVIIFSHF